MENRCLVSMPMVRRLFAGMFLAGAVAAFGPVRTAQGQEGVPDDVDAVLQDAARLSLAQGVAWLKQRGQENSDGWIIGQEQFAFSNVTRRYSMKTVWDPVHSYTNIVVFKQDHYGGAPQKTVERRIVGVIGSNAVERLVLDPNGSIEQTRPEFVRQAGGNIVWSSCAIGDEAFAVYALQEAGVPQGDPVLTKALDSLKNHVATHGLPDQTWNLAWLTAAFAVTPGEEAAGLTRRLASRLMDGQIADGSARGLWGTISVHHGLLAAMLRDYLVLTADLAKKEAKLKEKPGKMTEAAANEVRAMLEAYRTPVEHEICQRGFRFGAVEEPWVVDPQADPKVYMMGADHLLYNQTVADLESTWVALCALSIAAEHGRLPALTLRPKPPLKRDAGATPLPPPEKADVVLGRAVNALKALQRREGRWSECNFHQPVTSFDAFKTTLPVPVDPKSFPPLESPVTPFSTAQGLMALDSAGRAAGMNRLLAGHRPTYAAGAGALANAIEERQAIIQPKPNANPAWQREDFELLLALSRWPVALAAVGAPPPDKNSLVRLLVLGAAPTGNWGRNVAGRAMTSSARTRFEAMKNLPYVLNKAHIHLSQFQSANISPFRRNSEGFYTAVAVLFLARYLEAPGQVLAELEGQTDLDAKRQEAVNALRTAKAPVKPSAEASRPVPTQPAPTTTAPSRVPPAPSADDDIPAAPAAPVGAPPKADEGL